MNSPTTWRLGAPSIPDRQALPDVGPSGSNCIARSRSSEPPNSISIPLPHLLNGPGTHSSIKVSSPSPFPLFLSNPRSVSSPAASCSTSTSPMHVAEHGPLPRPHTILSHHHPSTPHFPFPTAPPLSTEWISFATNTVIGPLKAEFDQTIIRFQHELAGIQGASVGAARQASEAASRARDLEKQLQAQREDMSREVEMERARTRAMTERYEVECSRIKALEQESSNSRIHQNRVWKLEQTIQKELARVGELQQQLDQANGVIGDQGKSLATHKMLSLNFPQELAKLTSRLDETISERDSARKDLELAQDELESTRTAHLDQLQSTKNAELTRIADLESQCDHLQAVHENDLVLQRSQQESLEHMEKDCAELTTRLEELTELQTRFDVLQQTYQSAHRKRDEYKDRLAGLAARCNKEKQEKESLAAKNHYLLERHDALVLENVDLKERRGNLMRINMALHHEKDIAIEERDQMCAEKEQMREEMNVLLKKSHDPSGLADIIAAIPGLQDEIMKVYSGSIDEKRGSLLPLASPLTLASIQQPSARPWAKTEDSTPPPTSARTTQSSPCSRRPSLEFPPTPTTPTIPKRDYQSFSQEQSRSPDERRTRLKMEKEEEIESAGIGAISKPGNDNHIIPLASRLGGRRRESGQSFKLGNHNIDMGQ